MERVENDVYDVLRVESDKEYKGPPGHFGTFTPFQEIASIHSYKPFSKIYKNIDSLSASTYKHFQSQLRWDLTIIKYLDWFRVCSWV